jgi:hypothetical protein
VPGRPARRVREATRGNPPVETPAGRPESTSQPTSPTRGLGQNAARHVSMKVERAVFHWSTDIMLPHTLKLRRANQSGRDIF